MTEQAGMREPSIVAEVAAYAQRALVYAAQFGEFGEKALCVRDAHVVVGAAFKAHGRVGTDQIVTPGGEGKGVQLHPAPEFSL